MPHPAEIEPIEERRGDETIQTHPAFGQITVNRVSGARTLYGSDFIHHGFVRVAIYESEMCRAYSHDRPHHSLVPLIEVDMSEAQWGSFVSSFGVGMGTCCTLNVVGDERMPWLPYEDRAARHFDEAKAKIDKVAADLQTLRDKIAAGVQGLTKARQAEMLSAVESAITDLSSNLPFVAQSLSEAMEGRVEKAKSEVHAYVTNTVMRAGLGAIGRGDGPLLLERPEKVP